MNTISKWYDTAIIGGGIYGLFAADFLSARGMKVAIIEKEEKILDRASRANQARVHRGYHYPRSLATAAIVNKYYKRFCEDFSLSLIRPFKQYYGISAYESKTSRCEYIDFCKKIKIPLKEVPTEIFFKEGTISALYDVDEQCFDYLKIRNYYIDKFSEQYGVNIFYKTTIKNADIKNSKYFLALAQSNEMIVANNVLNLTYSNVNLVNKIFGFGGYDLKYELCQLMLCRPPKDFENTGLTVIDGDYFSIMPYGDGGLVSLSAVRYTPINTSFKLPQNLQFELYRKMFPKEASYYLWKKMEKVAKHYLNNNLKFRYCGVFTDIKPILISSEYDDSRPTIITVHRKNPGFVSTLAGKISTIYELEPVLESLL